MSSKDLDSYLGNYEYYLEKTSLKDAEDENALPISKTEKEKGKKEKTDKKSRKKRPNRKLWKIKFTK